MEYIERSIHAQVTARLFKGKILVVYGPRQSGKTTLVRHILAEYATKRTKYVSADDHTISHLLSSSGASGLAVFADNADLLVIDEAQYVPDIGRILQVLHETCPKTQIIATGSSSFELANRVIEPLTGRHIEFFVLPFSLGELHASGHYGGAEGAALETRMLYGMYPEIVTSTEDIRLKLERIANDYTSKDILRFDRIRKSEKLLHLLQALALQIGSEYSHHELGQTLGLDKETIDRYITILEQSFVIFRLNPYSRNDRRTLRRLKKVYFWDTGIRNALIQNFNPLNLRTDTGHMFENFCIAEMLKQSRNTLTPDRYYFWRSYGGDEIDLLRERDGTLSGYECKWNDVRSDISKRDHSPVSRVHIITNNTLHTFL